MVTQPYDDILDLAGRPPTWYDECRVPRFCEFHPSEVNDIYAREAALIEIACQECDRRFLVAEKWGILDYEVDYERPETCLASSRIANGEVITGGDPPFHGHTREPEDGESPSAKKERELGHPPCAAGFCMTCTPIRVVEFWDKQGRDWARRPELEVAFEFDTE